MPQTRRAIIATVLGNGLEWFDFTVYSFFAVIIGNLFFPASNALTSLLLAVATFGVGFFIRPVAGIIFGIYADKAGRKAALSLSMIAMALGSACIGLAPTYQQIGIAAPILIVLGRLLQGFSAGGEMASAAAFLTEYAPPGKRAYYTSWIPASTGLSVFLGAAMGISMNTLLDQQALYSWGWRIPFLLGVAIAPVAYYIRRYMDETPAYKMIPQNERVEFPLKEVLKKFPRECLSGFGIVILWTVCTYILLFYMPTYVVLALHLPPVTGFIAAMVGGICILCFCPFIGKLADQYDPQRFLSTAAGLILLLTYPMFSYINTQPNLTSLVIFQVLFGLLISLYTGPILAIFTQLFPTQVRSTGLSLAYNFAVTIFGGFAPFIVTWIFIKAGSNMAAALYVMVAAAISLIATLPIHLRKMHR